MAQGHIFIGLVTFARDEQYLSLFLERLLQQDHDDWSLHCIDTTVASNPATQSFAPRLRERLAAVLPPSRFSVVEYVAEDPQESTWARVANARNVLRDAFLRTDCPYFFFIDSDILLPSFAFSSLLSRPASVVSGVYLSALTFTETSLGRDVMKITPVAWINNVGDTTKARPLLILDVIPDRVIPVLYAGFGCVLIARDVFARFPIPQPTSAVGTEDIPFYNLLEEHKVVVMLDTKVKCAHLKFPLGDPRNAHLDFANYRLQVKKRT